MTWGPVSDLPEGPSSLQQRYSRPIGAESRAPLPRFRRNQLGDTGIGSRRLTSGDSRVERFIRAFEAIWAIKRFAYRSEVTRRLTLLRSACEDEGSPLSLDSVEQFVGFLKRHPLLGLPKLAVTPDGNVRASWSPDADQHFAVEFIGGGVVRFVLFAPRAAGIVARLAGTEMDAAILTHAKQLGANWLP